MTRSTADSTVDQVLHGGGEMAARMRALDWSRTPLGPVAGWPPSLRTIVGVLLASRHPMFVFWGPEHVGFYNDAYRRSLGPDRHPSALGRPGRETWAEIWSTIGPQIDTVMHGGPASWFEDQYLPITRGDRLTDAYWSYSYSAIPDGEGGVGGVLVTTQETTHRVVAEQRLRVLSELGMRQSEATSDAEVCAVTAAVFDAHPEVLSFALLYLLDAEAGVLRLAGSAGLAPGDPAAPREVALPPGAGDAPAAPWPLVQVVRGQTRLVLEGPLPTPLRLAPGRWPEPVREVVLLPLAGEGGRGGRVAGVLVAGANPRQPLDDAYRGFLDQIAREIAVALDVVPTRERERRLLDRVFALSPAFLAVLRGPEHIFELANPAYRQLVAHRDVVGRPVREALPELGDQGFFEILERVYRTGEPFVGDELPVRIRTAPGAPPEERYLNFVYQPMRDAAGAVTGVLVSGVDVTELVRARGDAERLAAAYDAERRQLLTVLEQSPLAILIFEPASRRILFSNAAVREILGYERLPDDFGALHADWRLRHPDGRPMTPAEGPIGRALAQGTPVTNEVLLAEHVVTGRRLELAETAAPVRDADGRIIAAVIIFADVTEARRTERQLRDAQRLQAVGTLAGGVAHEINNQMTAVLGFGSFILRALGPEHAQAADMRLVLQSAERAARVSQQLLAFTRQQVTQPRTLELRTLVTELEPLLQQLLGADKRLALAFGGGEIRIFADPDQVQQVLINLVANARDATDTGSEIRIAVDGVTLGAELPAPPVDPVAPGRYARLAVADTGHGMTPATLARIFEPFFTTKGVGKGTGLGLPMVYGTLRRHGGYVRARSAPGTGTTIELYWPLAAAFDAAPGAAAVGDGGTPAAPGGRGPGGGRLVLVAEDEPLVRSLAVRALEEEGYRVVAAEDGRRALEALTSDGARPDVVVTDVIMPGLNGRQLGDAVRARWPGVPVLYLSGHTGEGDVLQRLVPPGAPFLQKPFTPDALAHAVGALRAPAESPRRTSPPPR